MSRFSKNKDTDRLILSNIDDKELLKICSIDKNTWNNVCDEDFLKRRLLSKYPEIEIYKIKKESWKRFFLRTIHYIALMKEEFDYDYTFGDFKKQYDLLKKYNENLNNLLVTSAEEGELSLVIWSLKEANIHTRDVALDVALRRASEKGHLEVVKYLVEHGSNIRAYNDYVIRFASEDGHLEIVKYAVEHGADIHVDDDYALRFASLKGHLAVVMYLVEQGANIHAKNDQALRLAIERGHTEVVKYLTEHGANN